MVKNFKASQMTVHRKMNPAGKLSTFTIFVEVINRGANNFHSLLKPSLWSI